MQRGDGCVAGNGLDRGRVDVVVDGIDKTPACDVPTPNTNKDKKPTKPTTRTLQQHVQTKRETRITHSIRGSSGTPNRHHHDHDRCQRQYNK